MFEQDDLRLKLRKYVNSVRQFLSVESPREEKTTFKIFGLKRRNQKFILL